MKKILPYVAVIYITCMMLIFPQVTISCVKKSMNMCYEIIIPSLFPFFVCSGLLIYSGLSQTLSKICRPIMQPLFNINGSGSAALVLGIISGYPLGAVTACQLYESGYLSKSETERLLAFCNNSGPLFILGAVGSAIYSSHKIGTCLYVSHILAALTVGILFRFYKKDKHKAPEYSITQPDKSFPEVFSQVLANSINSIFTVCGAVIFFSVVTNFLSALLPKNDIIKSIFIGILELSGGTKSISESSLSLAGKIIASAFIVGFAGICVHLQVMAIAKKHNLCLFPYILGKLLHGLFAVVYTMIYLAIYPPYNAVFKNTAYALDAGFCMSSLYSGIGFISLCLLSMLVLAFLASRKLFKMRT